MKKRSKRYQKITQQLKEIDKSSAPQEEKGAVKEKLYEILEAVNILKQLPPVKFDATVELAIRLGIDAAKSEHQMRGSLSLPKGIGKTRKVIVFATGNEAE
ncbi:MAG: hypothetical protein V1709_03095, partial [Planctomycetota bacterium]